MRWLLLVLAACGAAVPPVPSKGGPAWIELESEHFTLWTDAGAARGRELVREMEYLHQIVYGVAFPGAPTAGRTFAFALRDKYEVGAYLPEQFQAWSLPLDSPVGVPMIVFAADTNDSDGHVVTHELTHVISHVVVRQQPSWFAEGIAQFFETVQLDTSKAVVEVGEPLKHQVQAVRHMSLVPGDQLFACKQTNCRDDRFYMTSALLFAFLANTRPADLLKYEDRLAAGSAAAWSEVFPDLPAPVLDRELRTWAIQGKHRIWHFNVKLDTVAIRERTLTDADVYTARAVMTSTYYFDAQPGLLAAALAADPTETIARVIDYLVRKHVDPAIAHATAAAHPDDWRSWWLVAFATTGDEAKIARAKMCTLTSTNPAINVAPAAPCPSVHPLDVEPASGEHGGQSVAPQ
jgi:hypothetical protein